MVPFYGITTFLINVCHDKEVSYLHPFPGFSFHLAYALRYICICAHNRGPALGWWSILAVTVILGESNLEIFTLLKIRVPFTLPLKFQSGQTIPPTRSILIFERVKFRYMSLPYISSFVEEGLLRYFFFCIVILSFKQDCHHMVYNINSIW